MRRISAIAIALLFCLSALAQTSVRFQLTDAQYGLSQTTNATVTVQPWSTGQNGQLTLLPLQLQQNTGITNVTVFTNLFGGPYAGFYHWIIAPQNSSARVQGNMWVYSTNLGTVSEGLLDQVAGAPQYPPGTWGFSSSAALLLFAQSSNNFNLGNVTQVVQSVAITQLYPTNGIAFYTNAQGQIFISNSVPTSGTANAIPNLNGFGTNTVITNSPGLYGTNLAAAYSLVIGNAFTLLSSTNVLGISNSCAEGTYEYYPIPNTYSNDVQPIYTISFSSPNWIIFSNGVGYYQNPALFGQYSAIGSAPLPVPMVYQGGYRYQDGWSYRGLQQNVNATTNWQNAVIATNSAITGNSQYRNAVTNNAVNPITFNSTLTFGASGYIVANGPGISDVIHNSGGYGSVLASLGNANGVMWTNNLNLIGTITANGVGLTNIPANQVGYSITTNYPTLSGTNIPCSTATGEAQIPWPSGFPFDLLGAALAATNFLNLASGTAAFCQTNQFDPALTANRATNGMGLPSATAAFCQTNQFDPALTANKATNGMGLPSATAAFCQTNQFDPAGSANKATNTMGLPSATAAFCQTNQFDGAGAAAAAALIVVQNSQFANSATNQNAASGHTNFLINIAGVQKGVDFLSLPWSTGSGGGGVGNVISNTTSFFNGLYVTNIQANYPTYPNLLIGQSTFLSGFSGPPASPQNISINALNPIFPLNGYGNIEMAGYYQTNGSGAQNNVTIGTSGIFTTSSGDFIFNNNAANNGIAATANNQFIIKTDAGVMINTNQSGGHMLNVNGDINATNIFIGNSNVVAMITNAPTVWNPTFHNVTSFGGNPWSTETGANIGVTNWSGNDIGANGTYMLLAGSINSYLNTNNPVFGMSSNGAGWLATSNGITIATANNSLVFTLVPPGAGNTPGAYIGNNLNGTGLHYVGTHNFDAIAATNGNFGTLNVQGGLVVANLTGNAATATLATNSINGNQFWVSNNIYGTVGGKVYSASGPGAALQACLNLMVTNGQYAGAAYSTALGGTLASGAAALFTSNMLGGSLTIYPWTSPNSIYYLPQGFYYSNYWETAGFTMRPAGNVNNVIIAGDSNAFSFPYIIDPIIGDQITTPFVRISDCTFCWSNATSKAIACNWQAAQPAVFSGNNFANLYVASTPDGWSFGWLNGGILGQSDIFGPNVTALPNAGIVAVAIGGGGEETVLRNSYICGCACGILISGGGHNNLQDVRFNAGWGTFSSYTNAYATNDISQPFAAGGFSVRACDLGLGPAILADMNAGGDDLAIDRLKCINGPVGVELMSGDTEYGFPKLNDCHFEVVGKPLVMATDTNNFGQAKLPNQLPNQIIAQVRDSADQDNTSGGIFAWQFNGTNFTLSTNLTPYMALSTNFVIDQGVYIKNGLPQWQVKSNNIVIGSY